MEKAWPGSQISIRKEAVAEGKLVEAKKEVVIVCQDMKKEINPWTLFFSYSPRAWGMAVAAAVDWA